MKALKVGKGKKRNKKEMNKAREKCMKITGCISLGGGSLNLLTIWGPAFPPDFVFYLVEQSLISQIKFEVNG